MCVTFPLHIVGLVVCVLAVTALLMRRCVWQWLAQPLPQTVRSVLCVCVMYFVVCCVLCALSFVLCTVCCVVLL